MCVVSNIGDYWGKRLPETHPWIDPYVNPNNPNYPQKYIPDGTTISSGPTKAEFDALKREVEELKKLLIAAQIYDEKTGQPHCEHEDKVKLIKKIAEMVGVDMKDVLDGDR